MGSTGSFLEIRRAGKETTYSRDNEGDENDALRQKKSLLFESAYQRQLTTSPSIPASAFIILVLSSFISFSRLSRLMRLSFPSNIFPRLHSVSPVPRSSSLRSGLWLYHLLSRLLPSLHYFLLASLF